jgi:predicted transcriptional regulator
LELALDQNIAEWIRQEARESKRTIGEVVTHLIKKELILRRSTAEAAAGFEVIYTPDTDR